MEIFLLVLLSPTEKLCQKRMKSIVVRLTVSQTLSYAELWLLVGVICSSSGRATGQRASGNLSCTADSGQEATILAVTVGNAPGLGGGRIFDGTPRVRDRVLWIAGLPPALREGCVPLLSGLGKGMKLRRVADAYEPKASVHLSLSVKAFV